MVFLDGTVGSGGHYGAVAPRRSGRHCVGIDRDEQALLRTRAAIERLKLRGSPATWWRRHLVTLRVVAGLTHGVNLALLDWSIVEQLDDPERGSAS
jgi:16S rRNA C1402 N4-methylase RsmH